jgi:FkbM family methyltransferase
MSDLQSKAKTIGKAILPKNVADFVRGCRYRGSLAHVNYILKLKKYRTRYEEANAAAPDSTIVLPAGCRIRIPPDAVIRDALEHFAWRDPEMVDEFVGFMNLASGATVLWDVGALFGVFSLAFTLTGKGRRALAFEPNPSSSAKLKECLKLNPAAKVEVFESAVGLPGEVVEFERGFHYTAVAGLSVRPNEKDLTRTETVSIDELIERGAAPPDIIKIDVEGHEFEVLKGARKLLLAKKPSLSIEVHPGLLEHKGTSALAIADYLEDAGYAFYDTQLNHLKKDFFDRGNNFRVFAR